MHSSDLIESVAFDAPVNVDDGSGGTQFGWAETTYACRAHFRYLRGGETVQAARLSGVQPVIVTIWSSAGALAIQTFWRLRDVRRGHVYNIRSIVPSDDRAWLELLCERGEAV